MVSCFEILFVCPGGSLNLPIADFLPFCRSGLTLTVHLDTDDTLSETNEANNQQAITAVTIDDGDGDFCLSEYYQRSFLNICVEKYNVALGVYAEKRIMVHN